MTMLTRKSLLLILAVISLSVTVPLGAVAQGIGEYGGLNAGMAGLGAGLAASLNHGAVVRRAYETTLEAQQALLAQNKAVEQYYKLGNQFELKKQWENAEKAFHYVVQVIAKRDGPGSPKSVPALKHLVAICQNQNKLDMAISYQKTVLTFTKGVKVPDPKVLIQETGRLSDLFIRKSDYVSAAPLLHDEVALLRETQVAPVQYQRTLKVYGSVLRHLDRLDEAKKVDDLLVSLSAEAKPLDSTAEVKSVEVKSAEVKPVESAPTAENTRKSAIPSILSSDYSAIAPDEVNGDQSKSSPAQAVAPALKETAALSENESKAKAAPAIAVPAIAVPGTDPPNISTNTALDTATVNQASAATGNQATAAAQLQASSTAASAALADENSSAGAEPSGSGSVDKPVLECQTDDASNSSSASPSPVPAQLPADSSTGTAQSKESVSRQAESEQSPALTK